MKINAVLITSILITTTLLSGTILASTLVSADDSVVDEINITVPVSCTLSGSGMTSHTASIPNGTYTPDIGTTTLHAFCNDAEGFAIYAAGYTGNEVGGTNSNKLVGTNASSNATIESGIATTAGNPDVSNWAMKLAISQDSGDTTGTNAFAIDSAPNVDLPSQAEQSATQAPFSQYHVVPNEYSKVAHKNSGTDMTESTGGVKLTTTYAAYISKTQAADTYSGQVKYTLIHPSSHPTPIANPATLDTGRTVNSKLESLAATVVNGEETIITPEFDPTADVDWENYGTYIKSINVHLKTATPAGFIPSEANTISASNSKKPIFIIFDNTNDAGIMNLYTEGDQIVLPADSSFMFYYFWMVSDLSFISDWDTSNVTDMRAMFAYTGFFADTFTMDLSDWDTSNVTDMSYLFDSAGESATTWSVGDLSSWNTSNVTNMYGMFAGAAYSATTWSIGDISSWNTSNVTNMRDMFSNAGYSATTFILDLSSWNTSNVTDMRDMFYYAGRSATTWSVTIPQTNGNNINNTTGQLFGQTSSVYGIPPTGRTFTLAQP